MKTNAATQFNHEIEVIVFRLCVYAKKKAIQPANSNANQIYNKMKHTYTPTHRMSARIAE